MAVLHKMGEMEGRQKEVCDRGGFGGSREVMENAVYFKRGGGRFK